MTAGRPVGQHIRTICEILERTGPATTRQIHKHTEDLLIGNVNNYCHRAMALGMMTVKLGSRKPKDCNIYTVNPDWRSLTGLPRPAREKQPEKKAKAPVRTSWHGVNSVFSMGAL